MYGKENLILDEKNLDLG